MTCLGLDLSKNSDFWSYTSSSMIDLSVGECYMFYKLFYVKTYETLGGRFSSRVRLETRKSDFLWENPPNVTSIILTHKRRLRSSLIDDAHLNFRANGTTSKSRLIGSYIKLGYYHRNPNKNCMILWYVHGSSWHVGVFRNSLVFLTFTIQLVCIFWTREMCLYLMRPSPNHPRTSHYVFSELARCDFI